MRLLLQMARSKAAELEAMSQHGRQLLHNALTGADTGESDPNAKRQKGGGQDNSESSGPANTLDALKSDVLQQLAGLALDQKDPLAAGQAVLELFRKLQNDPAKATALEELLA